MNNPAFSDIYIYIYIERERERERFVPFHIGSVINICIVIGGIALLNLHDFFDKPLAFLSLDSN